MPELVTCVACEKVIIAEDKTFSLITLFDGIEITVRGAADTAVPEFLPLKWQFMAHWWSSDEERGQTFEQLVQVEQPNGQKAKVHTLEFTPEAESHRTVISVVGFPTSVTGTSWIVLFLRKPEKGARWSKVGSVPVRITYLQEATGDVPSREQILPAQ